MRKVIYNSGNSTNMTSCGYPDASSSTNVQLFNRCSVPGSNTSNVHQPQGNTPVCEYRFINNNSSQSEASEPKPVSVKCKRELKDGKHKTLQHCSGVDTSLAKRKKRLRRKARNRANRKLKQANGNSVICDVQNSVSDLRVQESGQELVNNKLESIQHNGTGTNEHKRSVTFNIPDNSNKKSNLYMKPSSSDKAPSPSCCVAPPVLLSGSIPSPDQYVALDCEMVGVGQQKISALARCSIVDYDGNIVLDLYVKPRQPITDYRTKWSGIRPRDMRHAIPFKNAQNMIIKTVQKKIVIGHAIINDFKALQYFHPSHLVRDTSKYTPLREMARFDGRTPASLKRLTLALCGCSIQRGQHCSVEDSRATMSLFKLVCLDWERMLLAKPTIIQPIREQERIRRISNNRSLSESSDECYLNDSYWTEEEQAPMINVY